VSPSSGPAIAPNVRVVVVGYDAVDLTLACLRSLLTTSWPRDRIEIVLVDNASPGGLASTVREQLPDVAVIENPRNLGFGGGANVGLRDRTEVDYLAVLNNDATVRPDWLDPLVETLERNPELGAAAPKILLASPFVSVTIESPTHRRGRGDRRDLGVRLRGVRVDGEEVLAGTKVRRGTWGPESPGEWTSGAAELLVPVAGAGTTHCELLLDTEGTKRAVTSSGSAQAEFDVDPVPTWFTVPLGGKPTDIVYNAGSELSADDFGVDRGYLQADDGGFDVPADVFAWCGGAVLLRSRYLDDVGLFDQRLFLYYEDVDLSWRGRERGWAYRYVPESVVRHVHGATSAVTSPRTRVLIEGNRLLVLTRHTSRGRAPRAVARFVAVTASYARRDVMSPLLHGRRPDFSTVSLRLRALTRYLTKLPSFLPPRRPSLATASLDRSVDARNEP
jgi:GT2 family glycosyltransferase